MRHASFLCAVVATTLLAGETFACNHCSPVAATLVVPTASYNGCAQVVQAAPQVSYVQQVSYAPQQLAFVPQMSYGQVQAFAVQHQVVHQRAAFGGYGGGGFAARGSFGARGGRGGFRASGGIGGGGGGDLINELLPAAGAVGGALIGGPVGAGIGAFIGDRLRN